jgi:predicted permease
MGALLADFRYSLRILKKSPGFAAIAIVTLALGIGANSTIFSWINSTLLNPIPGVTRTSDLVTMTEGGTARAPIPFSYLDYMDLRNRSQSFSGMIAYHIRPMNLTGNGKPERVWGTLTSANYFDLLHVHPILGRGFLPVEDHKPGGAPVVVISYRLWQIRFSGNTSVIGKTLRINEQPFTIIGVAPAVFQGTQTGLRVELWVPLMMQAGLDSNHDKLQTRSETWLMLMGRLAPGVSRARAQAEMDLLMSHIVEQFPTSHLGANAVTLYPLWRAPFGANAYMYVLLPMLMAIAGVVLLLACTNVANLMLVKSVSRRHEIAIRLSIGASRSRLIRQLLVESLVLSLAGGVLAMFLAAWTTGTLAEFIPPTGIPIGLNIPIDRAVFFVTFAISVITGVIFGILPALRASDMSPVSVLKEEAGSASAGLHKARLSSALVVGQISLSLFLLVSAGLFIRSFRQAQQFNAGFNPDHVLLASYSLLPSGYSQARGLEFNRQLLAKLEALPGVESVSLSSWVPLGYTNSSLPASPEGYVPQPHESMEIAATTVGPNYLRTMEIPLVAGREFTAKDTDTSQPVAMVNQKFAERYWPQQNALGKRIFADGVWFTVIGVAHNANYNSLNEAPQPFLYLPTFQDYDSSPVIHARVSGNPLAYTAAVEKAIHSLDADLPVYDESTLKSRVQVASTGQRIAGTFVGAFGLLALLLAAVGIYGVISYTTRQRSHEIGIRMALGAQQSDVFRLVLGQGLRMIVSGLAIGLLVSFALTRFMRNILFGVGATDAVTFAAVAILLSVVALLACYIPARRAMRVDPMVALRYE